MRATLTLLSLQDEQEPLLMWNARVAADEEAGRTARLQVQARLGMADWQGDVYAASRIAEKLADNAAKHGRPFADGRVILWLTVLPETHELLIDVDDARPDFPNFEEVSSGARSESGLWWSRHYGAHLSWQVKKDDNGPVLGKTVRATVSARTAAASEPGAVR